MTFSQLFIFELRSALRQKLEYLNPLLFFILIVTLFPLTTVPDNQFLQSIAPGIIWVAALMASLLALQPLFRSDADSGFLDKLLLSPLSLTVSVNAKVMAHWVMTGLPIVLIAPILGMMLNLSWHAISMLMLSLLLGTPILSFIGAIAVSLSLSLKNNGLLLPLLIVPLFIPVMIFGASSVIAANNQLSSLGQIKILAALLLLVLIFAPFAIASALRIGEFQ